MSKDQAVILAALAFETWAVQNVGATSDWPADFRTDNEKTSDELSALLTELSRACKAYRETPELVTGSVDHQVMLNPLNLAEAAAELKRMQSERNALRLQLENKAEARAVWDDREKLRAELEALKKAARKARQVLESIPCCMQDNRCHEALALLPATKGEPNRHICPNGYGFGKCHLHPEVEFCGRAVWHCCEQEPAMHAVLREPDCPKCKEVEL